MKTNDKPKKDQESYNQDFNLEGLQACGRYISSFTNLRIYEVVTAG